MSDCVEVEQTHLLADGELSGDAAEAVRAHLATCESCQAELADLMQLAALPTPAPARATDVIPLAWYRRRAAQIGGVALAAAAGLAIYLGTKPRASSPPSVVALALASDRQLEARVAWGPAAGFRPYSVARGEQASHEAIPLTQLADVERTGDLQGVGVLALLDGDRAQAATYLERAATSSDVLADRAALALTEGKPTLALELTDRALDLSPGHAVATWNRALALRDLGLRHTASAAFHAVADRHEPGWAEEATKRAAALDAAINRELDDYLRIAGAASSMAQDGSGLTPDDARAAPGVARIELYDALRSAPNRERVEALRPIAAAIDAADHTATAIAAVDRGAPRAELAASYLAILSGHAPARAPYLAALRAAHADDLLIGALLALGDDGAVKPAELAEFAKLTAASPDPWIQVLGLEQQANAQLVRGDRDGAEAMFMRARPACAAGAPSFRCMKIALGLGELYLHEQRLGDARRSLDEAWHLMSQIGEWEYTSAIVPDFAELAVLADDATGGGLASARAYTAEAAARAAHEQRHGLRSLELGNDACDVVRWGHERVATVLVNQLRFTDAAHELTLVPPCSSPRSGNADAADAAFVRAEVMRLVGTPAQLDAVRAEIAAVRTAPTITPVDRALLDNAEGRLALARDPAAGEALLRRSIATAHATPGDPNARHVEGMGYSMIAVAAAERGDGADALHALSEELGVPDPARCALGLAAEDTTTIAVARGFDGAYVASHQARTTTVIDGATLVPREVVAALEHCDIVDVIARPPLHGVARILPDAIAWRYLGARKRPVAVAGEHRIVVADVVPPAELHLPRLATWSAAGAELISGDAATPERVLAAIGEASDVTIHAHGIADVSDASYLALSPDANGRYALTAAEVDAAQFHASPLVILAACRASQAAPVLHERWSLPAAFVSAGARAVIASASAIPDNDGGAFFDDVRARILRKSPVAIALRDARIAWIASHHEEWVRDVIVFE